MMQMGGKEKMEWASIPYHIYILKNGEIEFASLNFNLKPVLSGGPGHRRSNTEKNPVSKLLIAVVVESSLEIQPCKP